MLEPKRRAETLASVCAPGPLKFLALVTAMMTMGAAEAQTMDVRPSINTRLTYSDNIHAAEDNEQSDWVAEVAPGIAVVREQGRFTGRLNAQLRNVVHAREGDRDTSFVALQGNGQLEAVRNTLFVDMAAATSRSNRSSIFGRAGQDFLNTDSGDETRRFSIGPRWQFRVGDADGTASYRQTWYDGGGSTLGRDVGSSSVGLSNPDAFGRFGWGVQYNRTDTTYDDAADSELMQETTRGTLYLNASRKLRFFGTVGHEKTDYSVRSGEEGTIKGAGFDWFPTPRTSISGDTEDRFFGQSYHLSIGHRRARSEWDLSWSRDVTSSTDTDGAVFENPLFLQYYDMFAGFGLSPLEAQQAALDVLSLLDPGLRDNFITNNYYVSKALRGSFSIIGVRNRLTFALQRSESRRLGDPIVGAAFGDDLSIFNTIKTKAAIVSLDHSVSGTTTLTLSARRSVSEGSRSAEDAETKRTVLSAGLSRRLGAYTTAALTYRYQKATGTTEFTENVVTATLGMQF